MPSTTHACHEECPAECRTFCGADPASVSPAHNENENEIRNPPPSTTSGTKRPRCFDDLPGELRNEVYADSLQTESWYRPYTEYLTDMPRSDIDADAQALLAVSSSVGPEIATLLWPPRRFVLDLSSDDKIESGPLGRWLRTWGEVALPRLRYLRFDFDYAPFFLSINGEVPSTTTAHC